MHVFLDSPSDFENLCVNTRTLEVLGVNHCYVFDPNRIVRDRYGKSRTRRIKTVSSGAFFGVKLERIENPYEFLAELPGRKVATVPDQKAVPLTAFSFLPDDIILFGSESRGIDPELLSLCQARVTIPQQGVTESLNLAVSLGVILFEFLRQGTEQRERGCEDAIEGGCNP